MDDGGKGAQHYCISADMVAAGGSGFARRSIFAAPEAVAFSRRAAEVTSLLVRSQRRGFVEGWVWKTQVVRKKQQFLPLQKFF